MFVREIETKIRANQQQTNQKEIDNKTKDQTKTLHPPYIGPKLCGREIDTALKNKANKKQQQIIK